MTLPTSRRTGRRRTSSGTGPRSVLRQLRSDPSVAITFSTAVLMTALILTFTPGLFERLSATALEERLVGASPTSRNLEANRITKYPAQTGGDPYERVEVAMESFRTESMPQSVQSLIAGQSYLVDTPRFSVEPYPGDEPGPFPTFLVLRHQREVADNIRVVSGRLPQPAHPQNVWAGDDCPPIEMGGDPSAPPEAELVDLDEDGELECVDTEVPVYEVAVSTLTLDALGIDIGDRLMIAPDREDGLFIRVPSSLLDYRLIIEVSGVVEPLAPDAEYWFANNDLVRPRLRVNADFTDIFATALMSPDVYRSLSRDTGFALWDYSFRYFVDIERITPESAESLAEELRGLEANFAPVASVVTEEFTVRTGLTTILGDFIARRDLTIAMLVTTTGGLLVVALSVMALLAALAASKRRAATILLRNRGGSKGQLSISALSEGALLSVPAAAAAFLAAAYFAPSSGDFPLRAAVGLAAVATLLALLGAGPYVYGRLGSLQREEETIRTASARRIVAEMLLVAVAVVALVVLRRRGVSEPGRIDFLLGAGPALLGIAVGILTLRLYPAPIRLVAWVGSKLKGLVAFVGFRRILQLAPATRLPLTVILLAVAISVFASVVRTSIREGQEDSTWHRVGASHRLTARVPGETLPANLDLTPVSGIEASAPAALFPAVALRANVSDAPRTATLLAVDAQSLQQVSAGSRADARLPSFLMDPPGDLIGTREDPIPVLIIGRWTATGPPDRGLVFTLSLDRFQPSFIVTQVRSHFPGVTEPGPTVIASLPALSAFAAPTQVRPTDLFVRGPAHTGDELRRHLDIGTSTLRVESQAVLLSEIREEAFAVGVDIALTVTFGLAAAFAVVATLSSMALMARTRRRDLGYLRTLGLDRGQGLTLTMIEQIPPLVLAATVGGFLGVGVTQWLRPGIDVAAFTGPGLPVTLAFNPLYIALVTAGLVVAMTIAVVIFAYQDRRQDLGGVVKLGDE